MNADRHPPEQPLRALIYSRISYDSTGEGRSNERQENECRRLIEYRRWREVGVERDVSISASTGKVRPGWERVLERIAAGEVDVVVAYHLDRLTRTMTDLERLILVCQENDVAIVTEADKMDLTTETGVMVARILAAVARQEVDRKAARQKLAHKQRRAAGKTWSAVKAFGYTKDGEVIEHEADAIRQAAEDFLAGTTLAEIARRWTADGLSNAYNGGKAWTASGVRTVLANPRNAGHMVHDRQVVGRGDWAPILSETTHEIIKARLADPSRKAGTSRAGRRPSNLLTGIAVCATCGGTLRAGTTRGQETYACGKWHVSVHRALADSLVTGAFAAYAPEHISARTADASELLAAIEGHQQRLDSLGVSYARGGLTIDQLQSMSEEIRTEITELEAQVEAAAADPAPDTAAALMRRVVEFGESDDMDGKRALLARHAIITVRPKGRGQGALGPHEQLLVQVRTGEGDLRTILDLTEAPDPAMANL